ncbi:isoflavone 2'-hydroxylase-like, partial [Trifolium medium]|nr:isoflavone 2'-hydroxylase-like [Trifolium medium]
ISGLTEKYGNIISLWFGSRLVVVVSSLSEFQQCSTAYGDHWRNLRRITSLDVLSNHRINNFAGIQRDETHRLITKLAAESFADFAEVELSFMFFDMTFNNIVRMVSGK